MDDNTRKFGVIGDRKRQIRETVRLAYKALEKKGYNPINQLTGYLMSGDPTYITNHDGARNLICRIERDELLEELLRSYLHK